jgi:hypothetical protein
MTRSNSHPQTGRQDYIRSDASWRAKVEYYEAQLGHIICGAHLKESGTPCLRKPEEGHHRCPRHEIIHKRKPNEVVKYPSRTKYGMNMTGFIQCRRCKDLHCKARVNTEDDECPLEVNIYNEVMALKDKYDLGDYLQVGMLESVAQVFVKKFRCDRMIADEGMVVKEITGFDRQTGEPYTNKREHPLLKHASSLNKELLSFADAIEFSPKAQSRKQTDKDMAENGHMVVTSIMQHAHKLRGEVKE